MTIDEIKSVSIIQFLEIQGYHKTHVLKGNYWYLSPFRSEQSPSFNVNPIKNLWYDYGEGQGGNIINPNRSLEKASCQFLMTAIRKTALYMFGL